MIAGNVLYELKDDNQKYSTIKTQDYEEVQ